MTVRAGAPGRRAHASASCRSWVERHRGATGVDACRTRRATRRVRAGDELVLAGHGRGLRARRRSSASARSTPAALAGRDGRHRTVVDTERTVELAARRARACGTSTRSGRVTPSARGCEDCLRTGDRWVHLRICMTCGHVGCCDSSPNKHATAHHRADGHPIIKSLEPGEDWGWCYPDQLML